MKKGKSIVISLAFLLFALSSCEQEDQINSSKWVENSIVIDKNSVAPLTSVSLTKEEIDDQSCGDPVKTTVYAGQHIDIGNIIISNDDNYLYVSYDLSDTDWWLSETHLFAGDIEQAPFTNSGNPELGKFPFHGSHDLRQEYTFAVPLEDLDNTISIIAHAAVVQLSDGQITENESAFGYGDIQFPGSRWGWVINYEQQSCENGDEDGENEEGSSTGGNSDDSNTKQNINIGSQDESGCMDAYAYSGSQNSTCFLNDFSTWGWTNNIAYNSGYFNPGGLRYTYPLYASAFQCDTDNSILIGEVSIHISGGDSILHARITVTLTNRDLDITDLAIYTGETKYPMNVADQPSIALEDFTISEGNLNLKTYTTDSDKPEEWLGWFNESYLIVHVRVCPAQ